MKTSRLESFCLMVVFIMIFLIGVIFGAAYGSRMVIDFQVQLLENVEIGDVVVELNETLLVDNIYKKVMVEDLIGEDI